MNALKRVLPLLLVFVLCFGTPVLAAEPETSPTTETVKPEAPEKSEVPAEVAEKRQKDLDLLYQTLKEQHPNLFAVTEESVFLAKKAEIERSLSQDSDLRFIIELQELVALAKDSHTSTSLTSAITDYSMYPLAIKYYAGSWVVTTVEESDSSYLGQIATEINGKPIEEVIEVFSQLFSSDNRIRLRRQFEQSWYVADLLEAMGIAKPGEDVTLTVRDASGKTSELSVSPMNMDQLETAKLVKLASLRTSVPVTERDRTKYYKLEKLNSDTLYIQYNSCREDPELPMETFHGQVTDELKASGAKQVIFDLRYNGGGSDGVLIPLIVLANRLISEEEARVFCLVEEGTFSSAVINAMELKEAGAILVGGPTGGSVDHFGSVGSFTLPHTGLQVGYSQKNIELDSLLAEAAKYGVEPIRPDVVSQQTVSDYLAGVDTAVADILKNGASMEAVREPKEPLTRGLLISMLAEAAGQKLPPVNDGSSEEVYLERFPDVFKFAWYASAVEWAAEEGIVSGTPAGNFEPNRPVTREELAVIFDGFISTQSPKIKAAGSSDSSVSGETVFSDAAAIGSWARASVERMRKAGILNGRTDGSFDPKGTAVYSEAETMIKQLSLIKK